MIIENITGEKRKCSFAAPSSLKTRVLGMGSGRCNENPVCVAGPAELQFVEFQESPPYQGSMGDRSIQGSMGDPLILSNMSMDPINAILNWQHWLGFDAGRLRLFVKSLLMHESLLEECKIKFASAIPGTYPLFNDSQLIRFLSVFMNDEAIHVSVKRAFLERVPMEQLSLCFQRLSVESRVFVLRAFDFYGV